MNDTDDTLDQVDNIISKLSSTNPDINPDLTIITNLMNQSNQKERIQKLFNSYYYFYDKYVPNDYVKTKTIDSNKSLDQVLESQQRIINESKNESKNEDDQYKKLQEYYQKAVQDNTQYKACDLDNLPKYVEDIFKLNQFIIQLKDKALAKQYLKLTQKYQGAYNIYHFSCKQNVSEQNYNITAETVLKLNKNFTDIISKLKHTIAQ